MGGAFVIPAQNSRSKAVRKSILVEIILASHCSPGKGCHFYITFVLGLTFVGFKDVCSGETNVVFITNPLNEDLQHPIHVKNVQLVDTIEQSKVFIHRPDIRYCYENIFFINFLFSVPY